MLTIEGFDQACRANQRRMLAFLMIMSCLGLVCLLPFLIWAECNPSATNELKRLVLGYVGGGLFLIYMVTFIVGMCLLEQRMLRNRLSACPHCAKSLQQRRNWMIATHHCPYCGHRVITAPDECEKPSLTVDQLKAAGKQPRRWINLALGFGLLFGGAGLFVLLVYAKPNPGTFPLILSGLFGLLSLLVLGCGFWRAHVSMKRNSWCSCFHCFKPLDWRFLDLVIATRNCHHCGQRVIEEPVSLSPNRLNLEGLKALTTRYFGRDFVVFLFSLFLMVGGCVVDWVVLRNTALLDQIAQQPRGFVVVLLCLPVVPGLLILFLGTWVNSRMKKCDSRCLCPHCGELCLASGLVSTTGNCSSCGRRVLVEPEELFAVNSRE